MIYIAMPYTKLTALQREYYFHLSCWLAAKMFNERKQVFIPNLFAHPIASKYNLPVEWEFWKDYDEKFLSICTELWVIQLKGWEESVGVNAEIEYAKAHGIIVKFVTPEEIGWEIRHV